MENTSKAIIIDSENKKVYERDILADITANKTLSLLQGIVGGFIEAVAVGDTETLWVNEEGLLVNENYFFSIDGQTLAGNGVITGDKDGHTIGTKLTVEDIEKRVVFLGKMAIN